MAEIGEMLGVTRQRVAQLIETYEDFPKPEVEISGGRVWSRTAIETWIVTHPERGPGRPEEGKPRRRFFGGGSASVFDKLTDRARRSVVLAQEQARLLNHNYIGTEHLLLGLLVVAEGVAFQALNSLGVNAADVVREIDDLIGRGTTTPEGPIPFTPRTQKVFELSLRSALDLGHNYIGTEHLLLALVREGEGVAVQALERLGPKKEAVRQTVLDILQGLGPSARIPKPGLFPAPKEVALGEFVVCTFCGKPRTNVETMVAGSDVYICNECIGKAAEIVAGRPPRVVDVTQRLDVLERAVSELTRRLTDELRKRGEDA
jgi:predicted DNA-binding transcriptional regulator AlpA